jgi:molecular chaperone DnaJ
LLIPVPKKVTIKVRIPAGIEDGSRLRVGGEGEPGRDGGPRGDLYVYVQVKADPFFERHEHDLVCKVPVSYAQAALGAEIEVPTLTGSAKLKIPAGSQPNDLLRMRGLGVPGDHGRAGDQIVVVQITIQIDRKNCSKNSARSKTKPVSRRVFSIA